MRAIAIGRLSEETGVKVPTIRYYEEIGLLAPPERTPSNRRIYPPAAIGRLRFIRHARDLGFEVEAIRQLLVLADQPDRPCCEVDVIARAHLADIESRIARLGELRDEITRMVSECAHGRIGQCRVIEVLGDHGNCLHDRH